jgi:hypothetical protein
MDTASFKNAIRNERNFILRRALERLREGVFDPFAVRLLTTHEDKLVRAFEQGLSSPTGGLAPHLCICGDYGQGKSHSLAYLQEMALEKGFVTSMINLDPREITFHNLRLVYRELLGRIRFPDHEGDVASKWKSWTEALTTRAGDNGNHILALLPAEMPHLFKAVLAAMANKTIPLSAKQKGFKKHRKYRPRAFPSLLKRALSGEPVPVYPLRTACRYRNVDFYKEAPMKCRTHQEYLTQIYSLAALFKQMGYKGWVVFFDEGESIAQTRVTSRSGSYQSLDRLFSGHPSLTGLYPVFAFTDDFFFRVKEEKYENVRITKKGEFPSFAMNYANAWENLTLHRLHDLSGKEWTELSEKLLLLHMQAYEWTPEYGLVQKNMDKDLATAGTLETRLRIKSLINQLDIAHQEQVLHRP